MIQSDILAALPGIRHAFFTREGGVSTGIYSGLNGGLGSNDDRAAVLENRARMAQKLGVPAHHLLGLYQIHSPDVIVVEAPFGEERPKADAMVTRVPGLALGVSSADCGPILFADPKARVIGAAHSGWKGAFSGIMESTLAAMEGLGAARADIIAVLGPTIGATAYEVGPEFMDRFLADDDTDADLFAPSEKPGHAYFNLPGFIARRAEAAGVGRFADLGLCTYGDEARFYSYRRATHRNEADYGRLISAITLTA
jgi:YfiH family protein